MNKKAIYLMVLFSITMFTNLTYSQGVSIKNTSIAPNSNAILDIDDSNNNKGILIPRVSTTERENNFSLEIDEEGLTVYDTDTKTYWLWDGTTWNDFAGGGAGWELSGNSISSGDFIGTTNNEDFVIKTNNVEHLRVTTSGKLNTTNAYGSVSIGRAVGEGYRNIFIGYLSGSNCNTTGSWGDNIGSLNVGVGGYAAQNNINGRYNTAIGGYSLTQNQSGNQNTAVGESALRECVNGDNTALGYQAGDGVVMGDYNTLIGSGADVTVSNKDNQIAIGYNVVTVNSNEIRLGNSNNDAFYCEAALTTTSNAANLYIDNNGKIMKSTAKNDNINNSIGIKEQQKEIEQLQITISEIKKEIEILKNK